MVMCFFNMRQLVACMLLMVVLSTVHGQPVQPSSSDAYCPAEQLVNVEDRLNTMQQIISSMNNVEHLESKLVNIEDRLNSMQAIISSMNNDSHVEHLESQLASIESRLNRMQAIITASINKPLIKGNCTVDLASYGYGDSTVQGYVKTSGGSSEDVLVPDGLVGHRSTVRGVTLLELDPTTCMTRNRQNFDTYEFAEDRVQLLETLESATSGTIIVGVTVDTVDNSGNVVFKNSVGSFFTSYNMNISGLGYRGKFAFVLQKGYPKKSVFQIKPGGGDSLKMKIWVRGSSVYDVTFNRV